MDKKTGCQDVDWMQMIQHRFQWRALVDTVMNRRVLQKAENLLTSDYQLLNKDYDPWS
jgi:hypothetical protein